MNPCACGRMGESLYARVFVCVCVCVCVCLWDPVSNRAKVLICHQRAAWLSLSCQSSSPRDKHSASNTMRGRERERGRERGMDEVKRKQGGEGGMRKKDGKKGGRSAARGGRCGGTGGK